MRASNGNGKGRISVREERWKEQVKEDGKGW